MKKWSLIVAALYGLILVVVFFPTLILAFLKDLKLDSKWDGWPLIEWQFWLIIAVLVVAQFALLRVPVAVSSRRTVKQRSLWTTVLAAAFMMTLLVCGAGTSIFEVLTKLEPKWKGETWLWLLLGSGLASWGAWAAYFYKATKGVAPETQLGTLRRFLWSGSILELLVAIPTHIVARHRDYCCAGFLTFVGLTCGISVMLFAFGPAVYFLFAERWKRLHPKEAEALAASADAPARTVDMARLLVSRMRNFAVVTTVLYAFLWFGAVWLLGETAVTGSMKAGVRGFENTLDGSGIWPILAGLILAVYFFLRVPVAVASRQPVQTGARWSTVLAASFMMSLLVLGAGMSINEVLHGGILDPESKRRTQISGELMLISWLCWAIYFNLAIQSFPLERAMHRLRACLLFGSLVELVIALAMHVIVSQRDYHYVGGMTFFGLTCGLSVLLFAFGPAAYFRLVERWKRLHPAA